MSDRPRLEVLVQHRIGALALDVAFAVAAPWTVLFAPSGAGKSTVLRIVAGLVRPDAGTVVWKDAAGKAVVLTDTAAGVHLPAHRRGIRFVQQQAALFPHLSARENVAYGLHGVAREEVANRVQQVLKLCRVDHLAEKTPRALSGGEQQRVALARALAPVEQRILLLDEPFAGLDAGLRDDLVAELRESGWLGHAPVLQVTHEVGEVFAVGAEVIRMRDGRVAEQGPVAIVLEEERRRLMGQLGMGAGQRSHGFHGE